MRLSPETVAKLQLDPSCIRNICILAHVDHGKTSLSDSLLATNGIISQRMAGKARFLDSREDEQLRGITMEASAISLYFKVMRKQAQPADSGKEPEIEVKEHLINLIDSPGHIDFSSEVSTASRLCDGAVVLVDVVEGVLSQTVNVLRQCWVDGLKPILVLNKIDRLIIEWRLSPAEAYQHLARVIEQVNSVIGSFYSGERMQDDMIWRESGAEGEFQEKDDADIYFSPELNNVIFASAIDGWAFSVNSFAKIYLAKLGFSHSVLTKTLWGDFYLDMKNKKIIPGKKIKPNQSSLKPLFVGLILEQIWAVYENAYLERNDEKLEKIIAKLGAQISPRDLRSKDLKSLLNSIMSQWLPISHAVLGMVIDFLPSPVQAQNEKMDKLLTECMYNVFPDVKDHATLVNPQLEAALKSCDSSEPEKFTLAYTSKMISVPNDELPKEVVKTMSTAELAERTRKAREVAQKASEAAAALHEQQKADEDEFMLPPATPFEWEFEEDDFEEQDEAVPDETLIAFTRVFAGSLSKGQKVTVIGPKYDPSLPNDSLTNQQQLYQEVEIQDLYLIMGRELIRIDSVPAGNIVGIVGMDNIIIKNGTICTPSTDPSKPYINLASTSTLIHNKPIMQIAVEPTNLLKLGKLERGLNMLAKADPVFEWYIDDDSGEIIMCVSGELHLERCIKDLQDRFAKGCEVVVKEPVIPFREGLTPDESSAYVLEDDEILSHKVEDLELDFKVVALPTEMVKFLIDSENDLVALKRKGYKFEELTKSLIQAFKSFEDHEETIEKMGFESVEEMVGKIIAFGPKRIGPNMLIEGKSVNKFKHLFGPNPEQLFDSEANIVNGFQLAVNEGPLASEQMQGVAVIIDRCEKVESDGDDTPFLGQQGRIMTHTRDLIHERFLLKGARLFMAMYTCEIQTSTEALGKVYAVVQKRGGSIISEEMKEGTPFFTVEARIPVIEAYGFSEEIRRRTSGAASPQLVFDGYDVLDIDPFWVPHTEEELEELGEFAERENKGRRYMNNVRRRKGLFVDEKVVQNAEKQRTMKKD